MAKKGSKYSNASSIQHLFFILLVLSEAVLSEAVLSEAVLSEAVLSEAVLVLECGLAPQESLKSRFDFLAESYLS